MTERGSKLAEIVSATLTISAGGTDK